MIHPMRQTFPRRGATFLLFTVLLVVIMGVIAFAIDVGYVSLVRTQLQSVADSAAMAGAAVLNQGPTAVYQVAQHYASLQYAAGVQVSLANSDVEIGIWDNGAQTFTPTGSTGNAVRVTAYSNATPLFFARVLGQNNTNIQASAVSMTNPRDIVFVVDLSGSMNDDSEPCWATNEITNTFTPLGYPSVGNDLMQNLFSDLNYGSFPGTLQWVGAPLGVASNSSAYANLTKTGGPLTPSTVGSTYRISSSDSESTRKTKAYKWMIDYQIASVMPNAKPTPSSSSYFSFWEKYLDYVIQSQSVSGRGTLPPNQDSDRIDDFNNPNRSGFPSASVSVPQGYRNQIGYRTYVQFMMDHGRDTPVVGSTYTQLATASPDCPYHAEATDGGTFNFPPREQPTHACRRSLISAMQVIKERNQSIPNLNQRDWVAVVSFDKSSPGPVVKQSLTGDYDLAMQACTSLQAVSDIGASTATENGMIAAFNHTKPASQGGSGRESAKKYMVVLTDGSPNLYSSSNSTINTFMVNNPSTDYYGGGSYAYNAPIMQAVSLQLAGWSVFPVGIGLGTNYDFLDRVARTGGTSDDSGQSPRGSGNPAEYEQRLSEIFEEIIISPKCRLVQ